MFIVAALFGLAAAQIPIVAPFVSQVNLQVEYGDVMVYQGIGLSTEQAGSAPTLSLTSTTNNFTFFLAMMGVDARTAGHMDSRQYLSWLQADVETGLGQKILTSRSPAIISYALPNITASDKLQQSVLLLFKQPPDFQLPPHFNFSDARRKDFDVVQFARQASLGNPVAGTFFRIDIPNHAQGSLKAVQTANGGGGDRKSAAKALVVLAGFYTLWNILQAGLL